MDTLSDKNIKKQKEMIIVKVREWLLLGKEGNCDWGVIQGRNPEGNGKLPFLDLAGSDNDVCVIIIH